MVMTQNITLVCMLLSAAIAALYYIKQGLPIKDIYLVAASIFISIVSCKNIYKPYDFSLIYNLYFVIVLYTMSSIIMPSTKKIYFISLICYISYILSIMYFLSVDDPKIILVVFTCLTIVFLIYWYAFEIRTFTTSSILIFLYICLMTYVFIRCEHFDKIHIKAIIIFSQIMSFLVNTSYIIKSFLNDKKQISLSKED